MPEILINYADEKIIGVQLVEKVCFFKKKCLFSIPIPKPLSPGKGLYYWGYRP